MFDSVRALLTVKILQSYHDMKCFPRLSLSLAPRVGFCGHVSLSTILVGCFLSIFFLLVPFFFSPFLSRSPPVVCVAEGDEGERKRRGEEDVGKRPKITVGLSKLGF